MNRGPLPSTAGGPAGSDGSIDGVINGTSALLENISPYAIGKSARTGSDRNYQQIPHRFQYIIPKIWLPRFDDDGHVPHIPVSHAVDQGDIAFLLYGGSRAWWTSREQFAPRAPQCAFAGINVVNYILACLQRSNSDRWRSIRRDLVRDDQFVDALERTETTSIGDMLRFQAVRMLVQQCFVPHGICAGSEKQGGQHEHDGPQAVIAPVNFVITMTVDGKNIDLVNYWYDKSMVAGDELIFRLHKQKVQKTFDLTSYYKDPQSVQLPSRDDEVWQLVPDILRHDADTEQSDFCNDQNAWFHHKCQGYWRIAQTFQTRAKNNVHAFTRGTPLEVTFAPVWQDFVHCRDVSSYGTSKVSTKVTRFDDTASPTTPTPLVSVATKNSLTFYFNGTQAMKMVSAQNHYTITFDAQKCSVSKEAPGKEQQVNTNTTIDKRDFKCLHILFDANAANLVLQPRRPHSTALSRTPYHHDRSDRYTHLKASIKYTYNVPQMPRSAICPEYVVSLEASHVADEEAVYDADFLHLHKTSEWHVFGHNYWRLTGPKAYRDPTETARVLVMYTSVAAAPRASAAAIAAAAAPTIGRISYLRADTRAASDAMQIQDTSAIDALDAQAPAQSADMVAPKPAKRKKAKFLEPEAGHLE